MAEGSIETSLTTDYRKDRWGFERIVLDSISNHLPEDSNGTEVNVRVEQEGEWTDLLEADEESSVDRAVFEDDGDGFDSNLLGVLYSTKSADAQSVGQFGEGLKMVAAAAEREGVELEYRSRDWVARPFTEEETVEGDRVERLHFEVEERPEIEGSKTVFNSVPEGLTEEIMELPEKVLKLNPDYREVYEHRDRQKDYNPRIIDTTPEEDLVSNVVAGNTTRDIFVKGVKVQEEEAVFDYDLGLEEIKPDRSHADRDELLDEVEDTLKETDSREVVETLLQVANKASGADLIEYEAFSDRSNDDLLRTMEMKETFGAYGSGYGENIWEETFHEVFGEDAVIASDRNQDANKDAKGLGFEPVRLNDEVADYLSEQGVTRATDLDNERVYDWVSDNQLREEERELIQELDEQGREDLAALEVMEDELGEDIIERYSVPEVRVYEQVRFESGRELDDENPAVYIKNDGEENYIGIQRDVLEDEMDARVKYKEEWGHHITDRSDYRREFAEAFMKLDVAKDKLRD